MTVPTYSWTIKQSDITAPSSARALGSCHGGRFPCLPQSNFARKWQRALNPSKILTFRAKSGNLSDRLKASGLLAKNEDWLADAFGRMIRSEDVVSVDEVTGKRLGSVAVAEIEERILRCLGAAVIMQWHTIPTKLKRELFDTAGSLGDVRQTVTLRGQIARFLHSHKDEEPPTDAQYDERKT